LSAVGVVVIGRNEGERLQRCLRSIVGDAARVVYVDSGSTDGSVAYARSLDVDVIALDMSVPFTAARGRNAGFDFLRQRYPDLTYVQFVDGDCQMADDWLARGVQVLQERPDVGIAYGQVRERYPERSLYNRLCNLEWDTPLGESDYCGGNALMRVATLDQVGTFNPGLICGEEPELCLRVRRGGWKILRVPGEMVAHDAAMTRFWQWWRRSVRGGFAFAEGAARFGRGPERHFVRMTRSAWLWGLILPTIALAGAWPTLGWSLLLLGLYPLQMFRVYRRQRGRDWSQADRRLYAVFVVLAKIPQGFGGLRYWWSRLLGRQAALIEHKTAQPDGGSQHICDQPAERSTSA
jgi:GT2 family glycosyltransferase